MKKNLHNLRKISQSGNFRLPSVLVISTFALVFIFTTLSQSSRIIAKNAHQYPDSRNSDKIDLNRVAPASVYTYNILSGNDNGDGDKKESKKEKKARKAKSRLDGKYLSMYSTIDDFQFDAFEKDNPTNSFGTNFSNKRNPGKASSQVTRRINAKYLLEHSSIESFLADEYENK